MSEALKPLHHIEGEAAKASEAARRAHAADLEAFKMKKSVKAQMAKDALRAAMERKVVDLGTVQTAQGRDPEADALMWVSRRKNRCRCDIERAIPPMRHLRSC